MQIVVGGVGEVGYHFVEKFFKTGVNFTVIDTSAEVIQKISSQFPVHAIVGSILDESTFKKLPNTPDFFLATSDSDEKNVIASQIASRFGAVTTICRNRSLEEGKSPPNLQRAGIQYFMNPDLVTIRELERLILTPRTIESKYFLSNQAICLGFKITHESLLCGKSITDLSSWERYGIKFLMTLRNEITFFSIQEHDIQVDDVVYFCIRSERLEFLRELLGYYNQNRKKVFLSGMEKIILPLARSIENKSFYDVYLLEKDIGLCNKFSKHIQHGLTFHTDLMNSKLPPVEELVDADFFITIGEKEQENITAALIAEQCNVKNIFAGIGQVKLGPLIENSMKGTTAVCPKTLAANFLSQLMKSKSVNGFFQIKSTQLEVFEVEVRNYPFLCNKTIKELINEEMFVGMVKRQGYLFVPLLDEILRQEDTAIILGQSSKWEEILS